MTPLRQAFHAVLVVAGVSLATAAQAEPLLGPPTAAEAAELEAATQAAAAQAAAAQKPAPVLAKKPNAAPPAWLAAKAAPKAAAGKSATPSTGRMLGLLLVLGCLGGAAVYLKRRGPRQLKKSGAPQRLSVLSSTRIGPKAHAVVISVAGRQMLLGVTDSSVKRLAFIDELEEAEAPRTAARPEASSARAAALAVRAASPDPQRTRSFAELLKTAFSKPDPAASDPAVLLAAETHDVVGGRPAPSNLRMLDVEGQAQGLVRRLSGPRA